MGIATTTFDPADFLDDDEAITGYLTDAFETGDAAFIADALGVVTRAKGMQKVAADAGVSRPSLYRALSSAGNPELATLLKVCAALGLGLTVRPLKLT